MDNINGLHNRLEPLWQQNAWKGRKRSFGSNIRDMNTKYFIYPIKSEQWTESKATATAIAIVTPYTPIWTECVASFIIPPSIHMGWLVPLCCLALCSFWTSDAIVFFKAITCCMLLLGFISYLLCISFVVLLKIKKKEILSIQAKVSEATNDEIDCRSNGDQKHLCEWLIKYHWNSFTLSLSVSRLFLSFLAKKKKNNIRSEQFLPFNRFPFIRYFR